MLVVRQRVGVSDCNEGGVGKEIGAQYLGFLHFFFPFLQYKCSTTNSLSNVFKDKIFHFKFQITFDKVFFKKNI